MNEGLIPRRYATAMLKVAQKRNAAREVYERVKEFEQNFASHPDLQKALQNPVLSAHDKELLLATAIGNDPGEIYIRGIRLLIKQHREKYIRSIFLMYQQLYRRACHIGQVNIVTAMKLSPAVSIRIRKLVTDRTSDEIEFVEQVDPKIIGGFILRVNSRELDVSVGKELRDIRRKLK